MSSPGRSPSESTSMSIMEENPSALSVEHEDDYEDDDDDDSYSVDDSSESGSGSETEGEEEDEDDAASYVVQVIRNPTPQKRTEKQQEQQRRIVDLAGASSSTSDDENENDESYDETTTDGNTGYSTTENVNTMTTGEYDDESCTTSYSDGSKSTEKTHSRSAARQPPQQQQHHNKNLVLTDNAEEEEDETNSILTSTDVPHHTTTRASSTRSSSVATPRTGHLHSSTQFPKNTTSSTVPPTTMMPPSSSPRATMAHTRVPGGAAAKRMLLGPKGSKESTDNESTSHNILAQTSSTESSSMRINPDVLLAAEMQRVKEEFCTGSPSKTPRRSNNHTNNYDTYNNNTNNEDCASEANTNVSSTATTPSFLNRNEIFHRTASAAVEALLKPNKNNINNLTTSASNTTTETMSTTLHVGTFPHSPSHGYSPRSNAKKSPELYGQAAGHMPVAAPSPPLPEANPAVNPVLLSKETEKKLEEIQSKMMDPTKTLTDLLTAIASPENNEVETDPLGYAVRRKNACGALQTLTTTSTANRVRICWTAGVLAALQSVLTDGLQLLSAEAVGAEDPTSFPRRSWMNNNNDTRIRSEYEAARNRAIAALMNLATPVKNRIAVFHSPGLVHTVLQTIAQDHGPARRGCCAILACLAKSSENRLLLAQVPGLVEVVRKVLKPRPPRVEPVTTPPHKEKKVYPWSDEDESSSSESNSPSESKRRSRKGQATTNKQQQQKQQQSPNDLSFVSTTSSATGHSYDDSGTTPKVEGAHSPRELTGYDDTADELLQGARQNLFAMLGHLVKEKDNAYHFARDLAFLTTMVEISRYQESPSHALAVKILAHLTRHRLNKVMAFKPKIVVPALVEATQSPNNETRLYACYALQNLSQEKSCRQELAIADHLIEVLCDRCRNSVHDDERLAAISTLKNLCDEPANLIPMTNTTACVSTLMHFAHAAPTNDPPITPLMQYRACDALATLSHWLRKIATSGHSLDATHKGRPPTKGLFVPSLREVSWNQWT